MCPRAGRNTLLDDFGHTTGRRDGHHLAPVCKESLPLTRRATQGGCRTGKEVDGLLVERARILRRQRKEGVTLELHEMLPVVALRRRAGICRVERCSSRELDHVRLAHDARDVVDDDVAARE